MNKVAIIIPAYEPDERLIKLLEILDAKNLGPVYIVDDGSGDNYQKIFEKSKNIIARLGGILLVHEKNKGKGQALKTAFAYILENEQDIMAVVTADSDGQHTCECIGKVISAIQENEECLILGVRKFDTDGIPWKSRFGNNLTEKIFKYITGVHVTDTQTGLRGIPRSYMEELLDIKGERFEFEMRMLLDAAEKRKIIEVPIKTIYDSEENHQTHFNPLKDSIRIYRILGEKFVKYILSSVSSSLLDLILFGIFCMLLKKGHPVFYVTIATVTARVFSAIYNYLINYKVVFKSKENVGTSAIKYFLLAMIQMTCSAVLITILVKLLPFGMEVMYKIIIDTALFFVSYSIQQNLIFRKRKKG